MERLASDEQKSMREVRGTRNFYCLLVVFVNGVAAVIAVATKTHFGLTVTGVVVVMLGLVALHTWSETRCVRNRFANYRATVLENGRMAANDGQPL
jgi:S-adenosylmethionine/arginine decarboxylase-like enzyme